MSRHSRGSRQAPMGAPLRHARIIVEREHDPYRARRKPAAPTVCPSCDLVFAEGHWQPPRWPWGWAPALAHEQLCPACRRIREHLPAGHVRLAGGFLSAHREEVMNTIRQCEARARAEHPLQRIMEMEPDAGDIHITTTTSTSRAASARHCIGPTAGACSSTTRPASRCCGSPGRADGRGDVRQVDPPRARAAGEGEGEGEGEGRLAPAPSWLPAIRAIPPGPPASCNAGRSRPPARVPGRAPDPTRSARSAGRRAPIRRRGCAMRPRGR